MKAEGANKKRQPQRFGFFAFTELFFFSGWDCTLLLLSLIWAIRVNKPPLVNTDLKLCSKGWCQPNLCSVTRGGVLLLGTMLPYYF